MAVSWETLEQCVADCTACGLCRTRTHTVLGEGNRQAEILFIGEGPGAEEDKQGRPFVGPAGQLLTRMILAIGLRREDVYIANVVKCRPPGNRVPTPEEITACKDYIRAQTLLIHPKIIVLLGSTAIRALLDPHAAVSRVRGQWVEKKGYHMIATFHPSYLLRSPDEKSKAWEDFKQIRDKLAQLKKEEADG